jgi:MFS family permease
MQEPSAAAAGRPRTFAALSFPNYRLWFFGQMTSLFGTWMQSTAQGYLVYQLTSSEAWLGYVGFASGAATWIFMLYGGVIADRIPRRSLLLITQTFSMLLAFVLSALTFTRVVAPWHIVVLAFALGTVNAFDAPARQSFVLEMVDRDTLVNAIALNSTMFNTALAVGPALGGLAYAFFGPGWCFAINGVSFIAVIAALAAMKLSTGAPRAGSRGAVADIRAGFRAVMADRRILAVILLISAVSLFGMSFVTLLPAWAVVTLGGDATTNGFLQSARGIGALVAALGIATFVRGRMRGLAMTVGSVVFPALVFLFSFTRSVPSSVLLLVAAGGANIVVNNLANSIVQTLTPDSLRGRVMAIYTLAFFGLLPVGSLLAGTIASSAGAPLTVIFGAAGCFACAVAVTLAVPSLRRPI